MNKNGPKLGHNKKSLLNSPVEHIDIKSFDVRKIIDGIEKCLLLLEYSKSSGYL